VITVKDSRTYEPVQGIPVWGHRSSDGHWIYIGTTDSAGEFSLPDNYDDFDINPINDPDYNRNYETDKPVPIPIGDITVLLNHV
jgi:hypothetical protein